MAQLLGEVLGIDTGATGLGPWRAIALFAPDSRCVAALEVAILPLVLDGADGSAAAIRSVAVDPAWRGRGLFRRIMTEALAWADARTAGPALLYTEEPELYLRFSFRPLAQHVFAGPPPSPDAATPARRLDAAEAATLIRTVAPQRTPLSNQVALGVDTDLIIAKIAEGGWQVARLAELEATVVYERDGEELVIADIVAAAIPRLATIIGALGALPQRVKVLFPPDRLGWRGEPEPEDAGLMIRGAIPAAMARPFMLPPTAEF